MLQDMDHMEVSCVFYVKVHMFVQLKQSEIYVATVISFEIVMLPIRHDLIVSVCLV